MSLDRPTWRGRRKRFLRRWARDLRTMMPGLGLVLCFLSSAATITLAERMPLDDPANRAPVAFASATNTTEAMAETAAAARLPSPPPPESRIGYSTISSSSTSKVSAAPGGIRPLARLSP